MTMHVVVVLWFIAAWVLLMKELAKSWKRSDDNQ